MTRPSGALKRAGRWVMSIVMVAQLFGVLAGPLEHWRNSSRLGPHFEAAGSTQGHYSHDEAKCVACAIAHFTASAPRRSVEAPAVIVRRMPASTAVALSPRRALRTQAVPRAPPARPDVG